jgi:hypothetical protein
MCRYPQRIHSSSDISRKIGCGRHGKSLGSRVNRSNSLRNSRISLSNSAGPRAANLLIHLRHRRGPVWPRQRQAQRRPFHEPAPKCPRLHCQRLLPHHSAKRIAQVAHHPVRRHLPPPPYALGPHPPQPRRNLLPIIQIPQSLHSPKPPSRKTATIVSEWH